MNFVYVVATPPVSSMELSKIQLRFARSPRNNHLLGLDHSCQHFLVPSSMS